ncbi:MAG: hypothetical protein J6U40_02440 [Kiritimatiellae bacterium]|nr:hypothetical protein [Kiritimatiellia bacterium]
MKNSFNTILWPESEWRDPGKGDFELGEREAFANRQLLSTSIASDGNTVIQMTQSR